VPRSSASPTCAPRRDSRARQRCTGAQCDWPRTPRARVEAVAVAKRRPAERPTCEELGAVIRAVHLPEFRGRRARWPGQFDGHPWTDRHRPVVARGQPCTRSEELNVRARAHGRSPSSHARSARSARCPEAGRYPRAMPSMLALASKLDCAPPSAAPSGMPLGKCKPRGDLRCALDAGLEVPRAIEIW
jgi:hypothetical protein